MIKKVLIIILALVICVAATGCSSKKQDKYPAGTVEIVVPYAAGGGMDIFARTIQPYLAEQGIQTVVNNMPGGSTSIASMEVYNAPADGYKILCSGLESIICYNIAGLLEKEVTDFAQL